MKRDFVANAPSQQNSTIEMNPVVDGPVPATVSIIPVALSTRRTLLLVSSAMYKLSERSIATLNGVTNSASSAGP